MWKQAFGLMLCAVALACLAPMGGVWAASPETWKACENTYPADKSIPACTRIIQDKRESVADRVKALRQRAYGHALKQSHEQALADLAEALRLDPMAVTIYETRAYMRSTKRDLDGAIADMDESIRIKEMGYKLQRRAEYYREKGQEERARQDLERAASVYSEETAKAPAEAFSYLGRSQVRAELGNAREALDDMNTFMRLHKEANAYYNQQRGDLYMKLGEWAKAIEDYSEALRQQPDSSEFAYRRALAYRMAGNPKAAIAEYDKLIKKGYDLAEAHNYRGLAYAALGRFDRAIFDFKRAIEIFPEGAAAYYNRAQAARLAGRRDEAMGDYAKTLELEPHHIAARLGRARAHMEAGNTDGAQADIAEILRHEPNLATALYMHGLIQRSAGRAEAAIGDFTRAIELDPEVADFVGARAVTLAERGLHGEAIRDFTDALKLAPLRAALYSARAASRLQRGELAAALDDANRAHLLDADLAPAYLVRAAVHERADRAREAEADRVAAKEADARRNAPRQPPLGPMRIVMKGKYQADTGDFTMASVFEVRPNQIVYHTADSGSFAFASGGTAHNSMPGLCSGKATGSPRTMQATGTIRTDVIEVRFSSRLHHTVGPCTGMYFNFDEAFEIDVADGGCRFSYAQIKDVYDSGPNQSSKPHITDAPCLIEKIN
ncbi:MAG: tetratricopeptide repeat protein [Hyphomicrobiaceae bacterium]|nr:MAG: tetratricopeptide repeat protein [Hyphomicrobiaceae bacterium]